MNIHMFEHNLVLYSGLQEVMNVLPLLSVSLARRKCIKAYVSFAACLANKNMVTLEESSVRGHRRVKVKYF